jgi:hypothetical protein
MVSGASQLGTSIEAAGNAVAAPARSIDVSDVAGT